MRALVVVALKKSRGHRLSSSSKGGGLGAAAPRGEASPHCPTPLSGAFQVLPSVSIQQEGGLQADAPPACCMLRARSEPPGRHAWPLAGLSLA